MVEPPRFDRLGNAHLMIDDVQDHLQNSVDDGSAAGRPDIVRRFVEEHRGEALYAHECELLTPLLEGAGILYVVDGSRPYGIEYEAEMEILRWTARPRMALINMIGSGDYVEEWTTALGQYFGIVRRFDALTAEFDKRLELLGAVGQLSEQWRSNLERPRTAKLFVPSVHNANGNQLKPDHSINRFTTTFFSISFLLVLRR